MSGNLCQFIDVKQKIKDNAVTILMHPVNKNLMNAYMLGTVLVPWGNSSGQSNILALMELIF